MTCGPLPRSMEFTCLWSKDAQQKKRKRWTDGIARFSPATGLLSVWDQVRRSEQL